MLDFPKLSAAYQEALLGSVVPFYLQKSPDSRCGGFFDGLSATGEPIDTDKFIGQQALQTGAFAKLYNNIGGNESWLNQARHGADFLYQFAHDETGQCYAVVDRLGRPVAPAMDACTDAAVVMAYCQMHRATGSDEWAMLAKQTLGGMLDRRNARKTTEGLQIGGFRVLYHLSEPVAVLRALLDAQPLLSEETWKEATQALLDELLNEFLDKRQDILREWVQPEGAFLNTPEGRRLNVGLTFRAASVAHDLASETGNRKLAMQAANWTVQVCQWAWDEAAGGLDQWVDIKNQPLPYPDWKQRWAWVHLECLLALLKTHFFTHHPDSPKWLKRIHDFTFQHFPDAEHGGWHLALNRQTKPLFSAKATPTDGGADLIRPLLESWQTAEQCAKLKPVVGFNKGGLLGRRVV
jgi:N-acylglucosamine 2-epimerase